MARSLPTLAGRTEAHPDYKINRFFRWRTVGGSSFEIYAKNKKPLPGNWPTAIAPRVLAELEARGIDPLLPIVSTRAQVARAVVFVGEGLPLFPDSGQLQRIRRTRGALLVATNGFDRQLTELEIESYTRGTTLYLKTNLSSRDGKNDLVVSTLRSVNGIAAGHFSVYTHGHHLRLLGVKVNCTTNYGIQCYCKSRARDVVPAMWHVA